MGRSDRLLSSFLKVTFKLARLRTSKNQDNFLACANDLGKFYTRGYWVICYKVARIFVGMIGLLEFSLA